MPRADAERERILDEIEGEGDRAAAILVVTHIEDDLALTLRSRLRRDLTPAEEAALFYGDAPLATLSAKIKMAYALGAYGPKTRDDLNIFREIRNAFAHSRRTLEFEMPVVVTVLERLHVLKEFPLKEEYRETATITWRQKFVSAVYMVSGRLLTAPGLMSGRPKKATLP